VQAAHRTADRFLQEIVVQGAGAKLQPSVNATEKHPPLVLVIKALHRRRQQLHLNRIIGSRRT
jgi:hypothetical protein